MNFLLPFAHPPKLLGTSGYATLELRTSTKNLSRLSHARVESNHVMGKHARPCGYSANFDCATSAPAREPLRAPAAVLWGRKRWPQPAGVHRRQTSPLATLNS